MIKSNQATATATLYYWYDTEHINKSIVCGLLIGDKLVDFKPYITVEEFKDFCDKYNFKKAVNVIEKI